MIARSAADTPWPHRSQIASGSPRKGRPTPTNWKTCWWRGMKRVGHSLRGERLEHEHFHGEVGIDVVVAHEADHLASRELFDRAAHVRFHHGLPAAPQVEHRLTVARMVERLLADRKGVLQDDEHAVVTDGRLRLRRAAPRRAS